MSYRVDREKKLGGDVENNSVIASAGSNNPGFKKRKWVKKKGERKLRSRWTTPTALTPTSKNWYVGLHQINQNAEFLNWEVERSSDPNWSCNFFVANVHAAITTITFLTESL